MIIIKQIGRPDKYSDQHYLDVLEQNKDISYTELAEQYNVSRRTITRWIRRGKELKLGKGENI